MPQLDRRTLQNSLPQPAVLVGWIALIAVLAWSYHAAFADLRAMWNTPDYQHCYFVPVFAAVLLWLRRDMMVPLPERGSWWGLAFLACAALLQWGSVYLAFGVFNPTSLIFVVAGLVVLLGGWRAVRWAWPAVLFLFFMLPLPGAIETAMRYPLQHVGTLSSVFIVQTLGVPALAQGNVIYLPGGPVEVAEACSGLRMLMLFFALCVGAVFLIQGPLWEKIVILASAVPIAILSNVARIVARSLSQEWISLSFSQDYVHDWAGRLMPLFALLVLWGELVLLRKLFSEPEVDMPLSFDDSLAAVPLNPPPRTRGGREKSPLK